MIRTKMWI